MHLQADSAVFEALDRRSCSYHVDLMQAKCQGFPVSAHKKSLSNMGAESAKPTFPWYGHPCRVTTHPSRGLCCIAV